MFRSSIVRCAVRVAQSVAYQHTRAATLQEVVILSAVRTPIGSFNGALASVTGTKLGARALEGAIEKSGVPKEAINEVIFGNVISAGLGQAPARQVAVYAGLKYETVCTTVNKVCASGMKAVTMAAQNIALGHQTVVAAGGFESMSNAPFLLPKARQGLRYGNTELLDSIANDGLLDAFDGKPMGMAAEHCSAKYNFTRADQDAYAIEAYKKAANATKSGAFKDEIVGVKVPGKGGEVVVTEDEEFKKTEFEKIPKLRPAFKPDGVVTAANSSKINDGAAALILTSSAEAAAKGYKPVARLLGYADAEQAPIDFTTTPSIAIPIALQRAGLKLSDIDLFEINEAFAVVALANQKLLGLDPAKLNVNGGGVSLGHPIGCSGARIIATLINALRLRNGRYGVASICNGGGGATAVVIERL